MLAKNSPFTMPRVFSLLGRCVVTTSASASPSASTLAGMKPAPLMVFCGIYGSCTSTRMSKALHSLATRPPMRPKPTTSTVLPPRSKVVGTGGLLHSPCLVLRSYSKVPRAMLSISIIACSATLAAFASGVTVSGMPRAVSAGTSTAS